MMRWMLELLGAAVSGALLLFLIGTVKQRRYAERMRSKLAGAPAPRISRQERRRALKDAWRMISNVGKERPK